jgi:Ser/Thr protein kinase RdoA (MazF antagonist)
MTALDYRSIATRSETIARTALPEYGFASTSQLDLISVSENVTFSVQNAPTGRRHAVRVHRDGYHPRRDIESELAWIDELRADRTVRTPAVARTLTGDRVCEVDTASGPRHVVLFDWVEGHAPDEDDLLPWFEQIGEVTARLHQHSRTWTRPQAFSRMTWGFSEQLGPNGHWGRWQDSLGLDDDGRDVLGRCARTIEERLARFGCGADRFGLVHSDLRAANLMVSGDAVTVIDFDDCGFGWFLYDLAASLSFIEDRDDVPDLVDAWLTGYRTVTPLSADEVAELPTFVAMRRMLLTAWIASHPEADTARELGSAFTHGTLAVAERFLSTLG